MNNLYLISQDKNCEYDTYDSAVVVSNSEENAKLIHPSEYSKGYDSELGFYGCHSAGPNKSQKYELTYHGWTDPEYVEVELIGTTEKEIGTVVCSSFNAG